MRLAVGTRLGVHEVVALLGRGGMGEVYRAHDTRLKRDVAIKILPEEFALDADRVSRFQREAELLASLSHPHIAGIHELAEAHDVHYLVLEMVEGETLEQRLARGPIPVTEALTLAAQIAEAVEAAHEKGIVHRDLKPANVKLTPDGRVKVLDFGLAKLLTGQDAQLLSQSPTVVGASTPGTILGTAPYMSPEQARGYAADSRSDIFSFGCVLFEMLTGVRAFPGDTMADVFASIVTREPDWARLPAATPTPVRHLLRRCLQKDRRSRMRSMGDVAIELEEAVAEPPASRAAATTTASSWPRRVAWAAAAMAGLAVVAAAVIVGPPAAQPDTQVVRFAVPAPDRFFTRGTVVPYALSPDGRHLAFLAESPGRGLWVRSLDSSQARRIPATENARVLPFWSPDSRYVGYYSNNNLYKVAIADGNSELITAVHGFPLVTWNSRDILVLDIDGVLYQVSANGGRLQVLLEPPASSNVDFVAPQFLPDGDHFLYNVVGENRSLRGVWVRSLSSGAQQRLLPAPAVVTYAAGHLLTARNDKLVAYPFDPDRLTIAAEPVTLAPEPGRNATLDAFHVSASGTLAWTERAVGAAELVWRDRAGARTPVKLPPGLFRQIRLSPDGLRAAVLLESGANVRLLDMSSGVFSQLNTARRAEGDPVWSPDGRELAFTSLGNLYRQLVGSQDPRLFFESGENKWLHDWSADGRYLVFAKGNGVYALPTTGEPKPMTLVENEFPKDEFRVSPDSRWIAYNSDESGRAEVYVASFPQFDRRRQVSNAGGAIPRWRGDMKELYYLQPDGSLMVVDVRAGDALETSAPRPLFRADVQFTTVLDQYDATADGKRFLLIENEPGATSPPINIVTNWGQQLTR